MSFASLPFALSMHPRQDMAAILMLLPAGQQARAERVMREAWRRGWRELGFHPLCFELDGDLHYRDLSGVSPRDGLLWFLPSDEEIDENPPYEP